MSNYMERRPLPFLQLEEVAPIFKAKLLEVDENDALEFFRNEDCLTEEECSWFEIGCQN